MTRSIEARHGSGTSAEASQGELPDAREAIGRMGDEFRELARQRRFVRSGDDGSDRAPARTGDDRRLTDDIPAMLAEMARLADRVVEAREACGAATARAQHAEAELAAVNERLMAARALVHEAQRTTRLAAERCAWLEGRNATLEEALDTAIHASFFSRWRWRRRIAAHEAVHEPYGD